MKRLWRLPNSAGYLLAMAALMGNISPAQGRNDRDPNPPMRWADMTGCQTVIVGDYVDGSSYLLTLKVQRVLRGNQIRPGDLIHVPLQNRYSLQTTQPNELGLPGKLDGTPRLCYDQQWSNPGPLVPTPLTPDIRLPLVFFFPAPMRLRWSAGIRCSRRSWRMAGARCCTTSPWD